MIACSRAALVVLAILGSAAPLRAEVFVRWDQMPVPPRQTLGLATLVVPAANAAALRSAAAEGYRVYAEVDAASAVAFEDGSAFGVVVVGQSQEADVERLRERLKLPPERVMAVQAGAKWPHIRTNWVTRNKDVLQVAGRSAQPWIDSNAALLRIARAERPSHRPLLSYGWQPVTRAEQEEGPSLDDYLVAIAEAGSFGADLILPLHASFQKRLSAGEPEAAAEWTRIRRFLDFYSRDLPDPRQLLDNVAVVASQPLVWYEVMNLLARHNVPFELLRPEEIGARELSTFKLLILLDPPEPAGMAAVDAFVQRGGKVYKAAAAISDPNGFALEMRKLLGAEDRVTDIWNGITVLIAPYQRAKGEVLLTLVNYAHQELPVQARVRGTFVTVHYESPEQPRTAIPHQHRLGFTEFVLPALHVGGRVILTRDGIN
jgi:hypothetical protein